MNRVLARGLAFASGLALLLLLAVPARAQQADSREVEAKKDCLGGHPDRGIELLADLYAETGDPTYIYNQGRCFEQNGRNAEAVTRFREYLRKAPQVGADERAQVQARIDVLEAEARPSPPAAAVPPAAPGPVQPVAPVPAPPARPDSTSEARAHHLRIAAVAAAAVGVAAAAAGLVEGLRARSLSQEVTGDASRGVYSQSKFDSGERAQTISVIGFSVGGAALVTAGILYGLSRSHDEAPPVTALIDATGARAFWRMTF